MHYHPAASTLEEPASIDDVRRFLRSHTRAVLLIDGEARARKYVLDPNTGDPVSAADPWMLDASDFTFCIPDDCPGGLQLMVHPVTLDARTHIAADRYLAYHGDLDAQRLILWQIEAAKGGGGIFEGAEVSVPNPLQQIEFKLLKIVNTDLARLATVTQKALAKVWADPRAVGIDPWGIDIHSRFGMTRVCFENPISESTAPATINDFLNNPGS